MQLCSADTDCGSNMICSKSAGQVCLCASGFSARLDGSCGKLTALEFFAVFCKKWWESERENYM